MQSKATTVEQYLRELPADRREAISAVREVILKNLPQGFEEGMQYGMIGYFVPHKLYPAGYHCDPTQPLPFASLASQKNTTWPSTPWRSTATRKSTRGSSRRGPTPATNSTWASAASGSGNSTPSPLSVVAQLFKKVTVKQHIARYGAVHTRRTKPVKKAATKKTPRPKK